MNAPFVVHDFRTSDRIEDRSLLQQEILDALQQTPRSLPAKLFYDEHGAQLFEEITALPEYYLTRTERAIFTDHLGDMAQAIGPRPLVVEFGSGAGVKTQMLLENLMEPVAYVPIEISREQLLDASLALVDRFPNIEVFPVCADYTHYYELPQIDRHYATTLVFFPGSTIGNFDPDEAVEFLGRARTVVGSHAKLLIGVDLKKDRATIEAAYNDQAGVTASFNRNILDHIARIFATAIDASAFEHRAFYNSDEGRIEMHLVSNADQTIRLGDSDITFQAGEDIITEYSYKYDLNQFTSLLERAGWRHERMWTDAEQRFAVVLANAHAGPTT